MKRCVACLVILGIVWAVACGPEPPIVSPESQASPGQLHNLFLTELHGVLDSRGGPAGVSARDREDIVYTVTNGILERYGEAPMSREEIETALAHGVEIARAEDPWRMLEPFMSGSDYKWLQRYITSAEVWNAREVYDRQCELYGAPVPESVLWTCLDMTIASAEYWYTRRLERVPQKGVDGPQGVWWKRVIAAVVVCTADGVAGTLAGAAGGGVGGVVVGYLASYAVDDIIEGGSY